MRLTLSSQRSCFAFLYINQNNEGLFLCCDGDGSSGAKVYLRQSVTALITVVIGVAATEESPRYGTGTAGVWGDSPIIFLRKKKKRQNTAAFHGHGSNEPKYYGPLYIIFFLKWPYMVNLK